MNTTNANATNIIKENIEKYFYDSNVCFVFANSLSMRTWSDYAVTKDCDGKFGRVFESDRFLTWRQFRKDYLLKHEDASQIIPEDLRKLFVINLLSQNEEDSFLQTIINPNYKEFWQSSVDLLCQILPGLQEWKDAVEKTKDYVQDPEDKDFEILYERYKEYLSNNKLYEKAWCSIERQPKFENKKFIIFFPEQLNDFDIRYESKIAEYPEVTCIRLPEKQQELEVEYYKDVRTELRMTSLKIRKLLEEGVSVDTISILVPECDFETLRPYIHRELINHGIPCTVSSSKPLCNSSCVSIFNQIEKCVSNSFYFDNFSAILLNPFFHWKQEYKETLEEIVRIGKKNCCVLNVGEKDYWETSFEKESEERKTYNKIASFMKEICSSSSFTELNRSIRSFLHEFTNYTNFDEENKDIKNVPMQTCLLKLSELVVLEDTYKLAMGKVNPISIFNNYLSTLSIAVRPEDGGVSVIKYTDGIDANFDYKFVISASQSSIGLTYTPLDFIKNEEKRKKLGIISNNSYAKNLLNICASSKNVEFSCSQETFGDYGVPYIGFDKVIEDRKKDSDHPRVLKDITEKLERYEFNILESRIEGYTNYTERKKEKKKDDNLDDNLKHDIDIYLKNTNKLHNHSAKTGYSLVSQTDLAAFFPCPRKWLMKQYFSYREEDSDTSLLNRFDAGIINHKIIELFFEKEIMSGKELYTPEYMEAKKDRILNNLRTYTKEAINELTKHNKNIKKGLSKDCLLSQVDALANQVYTFLFNFLGDFIDTDPETNEKWRFGKAEEYRDHDFDDNKYKLFGNLDLLLYQKSNPPKYAIIDFKNGGLYNIHDKKTNSVNKEGKIKDFQCSVYVLIQKDKLLENTVENEKTQLDNMSFYSITKKDEKNKNEKKQIVKADEADDYNFTIHKLTEYCEKFINHNFQPNNNDASNLNYVDIDEDCRACKFKSMCRTTYVIGGRTL